MGLDLSKDNLGKIILRYGLPSIATMWIFALYTIVDGFFIGKFLGANELAAVNIVMPYVNLSFALGIMIAIGGATIISISLGEKNFEKAHRVYSLSLELFMILGGFSGCPGGKNTSTGPPRHRRSRTGCAGAGPPQCPAAWPAAPAHGR